MSGGSYDYMYERIESMYCERTFDPVINSLIHDLCKVLYELEWWQSGDTGEDQYRKTAERFKRKWIFPQTVAFETLNPLCEEVQKMNMQIQDVIILLKKKENPDGHA